MYLIPNSPQIYNRKWDLLATRYSPGAMPAALLPAPPAVTPQFLPVPFSSATLPPAATPPQKKTCAACACKGTGMGCGCGCSVSSRGIATPPQKRMGQLGQPAGVPAGSILAYTATWKDSKAQINTPDAVQRTIQQNLAVQYGIVIDSQIHSQSDYFNFSGTQSMTLQVHTTSDYGAATDIQSVIDGAIYAATNPHFAQGMPQSTIRVVQAVSTNTASLTAQLPPQQAAALAAAQAGFSDAQARGDAVSAGQFASQIQAITGSNPLGTGAGIGAWLSNNWMLLAAGGIGLVAAKELL